METVKHHLSDQAKGSLMALVYFILLAIITIILL
jgi:hypothetical protein